MHLLKCDLNTYLQIAIFNFHKSQYFENIQTNLEKEKNKIKKANYEKSFLKAYNLFSVWLEG